MCTSNDGSTIDTHGFALGDKVYLFTPDNPRMDGQEGTIMAFAEWGAHVATGIGSGGFRALFTEMVKQSQPTAKQEYDAATRSAQANGTASSTLGFQTPIPSSKPVSKVVITDKILSGYTGDVCDTCQGMRMRRNGVCLLCEDCGATSGCS